MSIAIQPSDERSRTLISGACALGVILLIFTHPGNGQKGNENRVPIHLPELNIPQTATLSPPYSCHHDPADGYGSTALFLSDYGKSHNGPELLFNGACGAVNVFDVNTNGDQMSLIADLGAIPLASVNTHQVFNLRNVATPADYTKFAQVAKVVEGHTYAVVINHAVVRGLLVFTVTRLIPDHRVDLEYEVKDYQINLAFQHAPGFDWGR